MNPGFDFRDAARVEFKNATKWYDDQQAGLGAQFVAEVEKVIRFCFSPIDIRSSMEICEKHWFRDFPTSFTIA